MSATSLAFTAPAATPAAGEAPRSSDASLSFALAALDAGTDAALAALAPDPEATAPYLIALVQRGDATLRALERALPPDIFAQPRLLTLLSRARLDQARLVRELTRLRPPARRCSHEFTSASDPLPAPTVSPLPARPPAGAQIALHSTAPFAPDNAPRARTGEGIAFCLAAPGAPDSNPPARPGAGEVISHLDATFDSHRDVNGLHEATCAAGATPAQVNRLPELPIGHANGGELETERQGQAHPPCLVSESELSPPRHASGEGAGGEIARAPAPPGALEEAYVRIIDPWSPLGWRAVPRAEVPPGAQLVPRHLWHPIHLGL
jgi:hypothetical protein